jgi:hypothetical protein
VSKINVTILLTRSNNVVALRGKSRKALANLIVILLATVLATLATIGKS